jgi:hypothetical protein
MGFSLMQKARVRKWFNDELKKEKPRKFPTHKTLADALTEELGFRVTPTVFNNVAKKFEIDISAIVTKYDHRKDAATAKEALVVIAEAVASLYSTIGADHSEEFEELLDRLGE